MLSLRIALRFLRNSPVQSALIATGIAVGIGVQVFLGSLIIGLQQDLVDQTIGSSPQITIQSAERGRPMRVTPALTEAVAGQQGVATQVPVWDVSAILREGAESVPLRLVGGRLQELDTIYGMTGKVVAGEARLDGADMLIGEDLAERYRLTPGASVRIVLPSGDAVVERVVGVLDLGSAAANLSQAFVSRQTAAGALGYSGAEVSAVHLQVDDVFASEAIAAELRSRPPLEGLSVTEWQSQNQDLLDALQGQSSSSYTIQVFVLIAVALGIASTLAISAVQKTRQIGILKAMGMKDRQTGRIFLWEAALLGLAGATAGVAVGLGLIALFALQGATFSFGPQWGFTAVSWVVGVLVAVVSSFVPSRRTARLDPIEVIQNG